MIKLLQQLKTVRLGVWILCVFIIYVGGTVIDILITPMSSSEMAWREERYYDNHYNRTQPNEKTPVYDYKKYHMIKLDGRYFLIPRAYGGFEGVAFYWPSKKPYSLYKQGDEKNEKIALIEVYFKSKINDYSDFNALKVDLSNPDSCSAPIGTLKRWNGLVIWLRFDDSHVQDWPQICLETVRILSLVKEVKNHD